MAKLPFVTAEKSHSILDNKYIKIIRCRTYPWLEKITPYPKPTTTSPPPPKLERERGVRERGRERERDRQTDRDGDRETDRQRGDRHTQRKRVTRQKQITNKQTNKQASKQTNKQTNQYTINGEYQYEILHSIFIWNSFYPLHNLLCSFHSRHAPTG